MYEDINGQGTDYQLVGFRNMQTEQNIRVIDIKDEITPKKQICTLEHTEVYIKVGKFHSGYKAERNKV